MTIPTQLHALVQLLGLDGTQRFLVVAQSQIHQCKQDLLTSLQQQDWDSAATIAHRLKATAHLYSSATLLEQLEHIVDKRTTTLQHPHFSQVLITEFRDIEVSIQMFISNK